MQTGLVPIGMNPKTRLWEFYHLRSAFDAASGEDAASIEIPSHREDGSISVTEKTGIVFVLVPGGTAPLGSQSTERGGKNFDRFAAPGDEVEDTVIRPFFLARHELTLGQWTRLAHGEKGPSSWSKSGRHPVDTVSWKRCYALMERHGLEMPDTDEWEYACRAGASTPWSCGAKPVDLKGHANVLDVAAKRGAPEWSEGFESFDDGFVMPAPVGSFRANRFGLYDMHGNVWEWCGTPLIRINMSTPVTTFPYVGGSFRTPARDARSSHRLYFAAETENDSVGVRAARKLQAERD